MSIRENIQIFHPIDIEEYLKILKTKYGAQEHPKQAEAFLIEELPFYAPRQAEEYVFILGFNMAPLSLVLIQALADSLDLAPKNTRILWTQEQYLIMDILLNDFINKKGLR